ncbi:MAG: hypothetical protein A4S12_02895 [Proteobacteria bacterium SG_bin5]|nr:MAG: hypothetical protein A4S12_02895 [Proteobacteria bacterium SG_bin5]
MRSKRAAFVHRRVKDADDQDFAADIAIKYSMRPVRQAARGRAQFRPRFAGEGMPAKQGEAILEPGHMLADGIQAEILQAALLDLN